MAYSPCDSERTTAALVQAIGAVLLIVAPWVGTRTAAFRSSPYVRYWVKANLIWSVCAVVFGCGAVAAQYVLQVHGLLGAVILAHIVMCVMGAFSATFNLPFGYLFVASLFCEREWWAIRRPGRAAAEMADPDD